MDLLYSGIIWYIVFLFSTTLHEAAHAFVGWKLGDSTAYHGGQVTLEPSPHMQREPIGMILVPILSFILLKGSFMMGWASAPYDPLWAGRYPKRAAYMALAGPGANLVLVLLAAAAIHLGLYFDVFYEPQKMQFDDIVQSYSTGTTAILATFCSVMFSLNVVLFAFNLLPFPPLDGSRLFPLFVPEELAIRMMGVLHQPGVGLVGILAAWYFFDIIFKPLHLLAINLLYPWLNYAPVLQ